MKKLLFAFLTVITLFSACIGDDFVEDTVDPVLRITTVVDTIQKGEQFQFTAMYLNNVGQEETVAKTWESNNTSVITIDNNGLATAIEEGDATITVSFNDGPTTITDEINVSVGDQTVVQPASRTGSIRVTSNYILEGNFELSEDNGELTLKIDDTYRASAGLPGLYIYLTNNPNTTSGAYEIGKVDVFSGAHQYVINDGVGLNDYSHILYFCKPFNIKVGDGAFD